MNNQSAQISAATTNTLNKSATTDNTQKMVNGTASVGGATTTTNLNQSQTMPTTNTNLTSNTNVNGNVSLQQNGTQQASTQGGNIGSAAGNAIKNTNQQTTVNTNVGAGTGSVINSTNNNQITQQQQQQVQQNVNGLVNNTATTNSNLQTQPKPSIQGSTTSNLVQGGGNTTTGLNNQVNNTINPKLEETKTQINSTTTASDLNNSNTLQQQQQNNLVNGTAATKQGAQTTTTATLNNSATANVNQLQQNSTNVQGNASKTVNPLTQSQEIAAGTLIQDNKPNPKQQSINAPTTNTTQNTQGTIKQQQQDQQIKSSTQITDKNTPAQINNNTASTNKQQPTTTTTQNNQMQKSSSIVVPQEQLVTDKDLQGKTPQQQREFLEAKKKKLTDQLGLEQKQFMRQTTSLARKSMQMKKESIKIQKLLISEQIEQDKRMLKRYEEKKVQAERELQVEEQKLSGSSSQVNVNATPSKTGTNASTDKVQNTPLTTDNQAKTGTATTDPKNQTPAKQDPKQQNITTPAVKSNQIHVKLQSEIEILKARIIESERIKLELEELIEEKSEIMKSKSELQVKNDGLSVGIQRQSEELKRLDTEVEKKKQEEVQALKAQNNKALDSLRILSKVETSIKNHYQDQELKSLELQYAELQNKIKTQIVLNQDQLDQEIQGTQTLKAKADSHNDLKALRDDIQVTKDQIAKEQDKIKNTEQQIINLNSKIQEIDILYHKEEERSRDLKQQRFDVNQQIIDSSNLPLQSQPIGYDKLEVKQLNKQQTQFNSSSKSNFGLTSTNQEYDLKGQLTSTVQSSTQGKGGLRKSQTSGSSNLFDNSPIINEEQNLMSMNKKQRVRFQLDNEAHNHQQNMKVRETEISHVELEVLSENYLQKHEQLLQIEAKTYDMYLFFIATITILILVNIYFQNYKTIDPLPQYLKLACDFVCQSMKWAKGEVNNLLQKF
eukprot:403330632